MSFFFRQFIFIGCVCVDSFIKNFVVKFCSILKTITYRPFSVIYGKHCAVKIICDFSHLVDFIQISTNLIIAKKAAKSFACMLFNLRKTRIPPPKTATLNLGEKWIKIIIKCYNYNAKSVLDKNEKYNYNTRKM